MDKDVHEPLRRDSPHPFGITFSKEHRNCLKMSPPFRRTRCGAAGCGMEALEGPEEGGRPPEGSTVVTKTLAGSSVFGFLVVTGTSVDSSSFGSVVATGTTSSDLNSSDISRRVANGATERTSSVEGGFKGYPQR